MMRDGLKKINDILAGLPLTIVGAVCLIISFVFSRIGLEFPVDPAWGAVIICGIPLLYLALWRVVHNPGISKISSALLIVIAMFAAIFIGDLFAAGEVAFIMALGAILEDMTTDRAKKGLKKLISLAPAQGRRIRDGKEELIPAEQIRKGDVLRVLPGETIPVDGVILRGETSVDQSVMTGESLPVDKGENDELFCGTLNCFGSVDMEATKVGEDSSLQKLIRMVQDAENKQAPMQRIADRAASYLVPIALLIAIIAGVVQQNLVTAVTVLVVFCPCALVLATPTAIMAAIGQATKNGVIIKSGEALEKLGHVNTIAFDKTGTLTRGQLTVSDIVLSQGAEAAELLGELSFWCADSPETAGITESSKSDSKCSNQIRNTSENKTENITEAIIENKTENIHENENRLLVLTASAEARSEHPLAKAITACAAKRGLSAFDTQDFHMTSGRGIISSVGGKTVLCGSEAFMRENQIQIPGSLQQELRRCREEGKAVVITAAEHTVLGLIALSDGLRPETKEVLQKLRDMGVDTVMLTGDHQETAEYLMRDTALTEIRAGLLPEDKVSALQKISDRGHQVCMIGDGVNDAPALKTADVGVAMGSMGSDIAVEAADIALMSDDLTKVPYLKRLANGTVKTIKGSITLSMCINCVAIILSVLGVLTPTTGALVHNAGSCFVVLIAALLYDRKFE